MNVGRIERANADGISTLYGEPRDHLKANGPEVVRRAEAFFSRYAVLPSGTLLPSALWTIGTHTFESFDSFAYLAVTSPTPRCGKTRVLELLSLLCANPVRTSNISEAALYRLIASFKPTLLLDEMEQLREKGERPQILRNLINAGNRRDAVTIRCTERGASIEQCGVYCPKALAAIGSLPDTIADRAIVFQMQRRTREEKIERFLHRLAEPQAREIREAIAGWTVVNREAIQETYLAAADLTFLEDRDAESWAPLFSILAVADPSRLEELRGCAEMLCGAKQTDAVDEQICVRLVRDAASVLRDNERYIASAELLKRLRTIDDSPSNEPTFDQRQLAKHFRTFGLRSKPVRIVDSTPRGYETEKIRDCARRYGGASSETSATYNENKDLQISVVADVALTSELREETPGDVE